MGFVDFLILAALAICLIYGFTKGLIGMFIRLAGTILCFILVSHFYPAVSQKLIISFGLDSTLSSIVATILIIVSVSVVVKIAVSLANKALSILYLGWLNRIMGAITGALVGLALVLTIMVFMDFTSSRWDLEKQRLGISFISPTLGPNEADGPVVSRVRIIKRDLLTRFNLAGGFASPFFRSIPEKETDPIPPTGS